MALNSVFCILKEQFQQASVYRCNFHTILALRTIIGAAGENCGLFYILKTSKTNPNLPGFFFHIWFNVGFGSELQESWNSCAWRFCWLTLYWWRHRVWAETAAAEILSCREAFPKWDPSLAIPLLKGSQQSIYIGSSLRLMARESRKEFALHRCR